MRSLAIVLALVSTATAADPREEARAHCQAGVARYDAGDYKRALLDFQRAQASSHQPDLYFNMAACEEKLEHYQAAAALLRQYLLERPYAGDRSQVEMRI